MTTKIFVHQKHQNGIFMKFDAHFHSEQKRFAGWTNVYLNIFNLYVWTRIHTRNVHHLIRKKSKIVVHIHSFNFFEISKNDCFSFSLQFQSKKQINPKHYQRHEQHPYSIHEILRFFIFAHIFI